MDGVDIAFKGKVNVLSHYAAVTAYFGIKPFRTDGFDGLPFPPGGDSRAGLDYGNAQFVKLEGYPDFFFGGQCHSGGLFTIPECGIQKTYISE
jgi:hypothetical protein